MLLSFEKERRGRKKKEEKEKEMESNLVNFAKNREVVVSFLIFCPSDVKTVLFPLRRSWTPV